MRVVVLTGEQPNQAALCHKLAAHCEIVGLVLSENVPRKQPDFSKRVQLLSNRVAGRLVGQPFVDAWQYLQRSYAKRFPQFPDVPTTRVHNVNDAATVDVIDQTAPDLIVVSGTNLVGKRVIEAAAKRGGVVNLHTGISPYVKGGPNCTNWCLAEGTFHLIGNTVMWLDAGIDTGKIIATEQTPLAGRETLRELHWKVMEHGQSLYVRAVRKIGRGESVPAVPQSSVAEGTTFYTAQWDAAAMRRAWKNFNRDYAGYFADAARLRADSAALQLFPLVEAEAATSR